MRCDAYDDDASPSPSPGLLQYKDTVAKMAGELKSLAAQEGEGASKQRIALLTRFKAFDKDIEALRQAAMS